MHALAVAEGAPRFLRECAVEVAAILGFRSVSLEFPILRGEGRGSAPPGGEGLVFSLAAAGPGGPGHSICRAGRLVELSLRGPEESGGLLLRLLSSFDEILARDGYAADSSGPAPEPSGPPPPFARPGAMESGYHPEPRARGLESLFERGYLVVDEDYDFLPDRIDARIALPAKLDEHVLSAACDLAARLGMECLGLDLPILEDRGAPAGGKPSCLIRIEEAAAPSILLGEESGRRLVSVRGSGPELSRMASALCRSAPGTGDPSPLAELRDGLAEALELGGPDGLLSWVEAARPPAGTVARLGPGLQAAALEARFPGLRVEDARRLERVAGREIPLPSEIEALRALLEREAYPRLVRGARARIEVVAGKGLEARRGLEAEIRERALAAGARDPEVRVVGAFKQGLSWLRDLVLPRLRALGGVDSVDIGFSAFLPAGREAWTDEDGATPRITAERADDPRAWLDSPIRLLQELYPADDLIAAALGIDRGRVRFSLGGPEGTRPGYLLAARGRDGRAVFEDAFFPSYAERPYLEDFPGIGLTHPGTGRLRVEIGEGAAWEGGFRTDLESVWDAYQREILPAARRLAEAGGAAAYAGQPFFERLVVEVEADEPEEPLGCRQDRLSSLESLHEDLYFAGLDYFQTLGVKTEGRGFDSPGLILPVLRRRAGPPRLRYELSRRASAGAGPGLLLPGGGAAVPPSGPGAAVHVDRLDYDPAGGGFAPRFKVEAVPIPGQSGAPSAGAFCAAWGRLLSEGLLSSSPAAAGLPGLSLAVGEELLAVAPPPAAPAPEEEDLAGIDLGEASLLDPERYEAIAARLASVRGLNARKVAASRLGRPILAFELKPRLSGYVSRTKLVASRPTCYVNARHHANEVSSTNSALMLLRRVLSDPAYADLPERLNLVVLPLENVDGAAIHAELAAENPEWILHTARYDSLGMEFARAYFDDATVHTEAKAFSRVWRDWLPDVVVDDHGVPSHEWCQQFSGYTSPWFKGFWMPRALLYGYFWHVTDEAWAANKAVAEGIRDAVAARFGTDPEFRRINEEWRERFEKYAHSWMPRLFPAEYHGGLIFYWVPWAYKPDYYYTAVRFPWVTASSFVSEVADETATGDYLGLCARAHLEEDLAIVDLLAGGEATFDEAYWASEGRVRARRARRRPPELAQRG